MNPKILFLSVFLSGAVPIHAQKIISATPEAAGFSSERLKRIDATLTDWTNKGWMNGAVGMVIRDGKIVYYKSVGYNDLNTKAPLAKDGIFRIASQSKAITSVAVMMLYEEGKFLLDDAVSKYIPAYDKAKVLDKFNEKDTTYTTVDAKRAVTIRDLLTHTSGIDYAQIGSKEANAIYAKHRITAGLDVRDDKLSDAMNRLGVLPLMHQPGEKWTYGLNTDLLGYLVEIWSGMTLDEFFSKRIFAPLGMNDTYFNVPSQKAGRLVNFFMEDSLGHLKVQNGTPGSFGLSMDYPLQKKAYFSGGGGLSSTVYDYGVFLQMLLNGGQYNGVRILSRNSVRMMTMNQIGDLNLGEEKFGLGFSIVTDKSSRLQSFTSRNRMHGVELSRLPILWTLLKRWLCCFTDRLWGSHGDLSEKFRTLDYQSLND